MSQEIKNRIKKVLVSKMLPGMSADAIGNDAPLIELGVGLDSIATLEFVVALEKEFQISIDEKEINLELLATVNNISDYISTRLETA